MKNKVFDWIILILGISCLIIMMGIFYNIGLFVDEHNLSMSNILGGIVWQYLYWFMGILSLSICGVSIISLKKRN